MIKIVTTQTFLLCLGACLFLSFFGCNGKTVENGNICLALGDYPLAISFFETRLKKVPEDYSARLGLGKALLQKAADKADMEAWYYALIQLEACRTITPSDELNLLLCDAYKEQARLLLNSKDTVSALESLSHAIELNRRDVEPVNLAGIIYYNMREVTKAEALFLKAINLDSLHPTALYNLGMICWQQQDVAGARDYLLRALKIVPQDEDVLYWFARAEKRIRDRH
ncbi:MAG: tetratricopeptide repeat protein [Fibrobacteria bacterium]|nr:tetratricopeptide repeat protein [Fibrobacteria bacterium]